MSRQRLVALLAAVAVGAAAIGWLAGSQLTSSNDARLSREPPKASLITAEVERRQLTANLVLRGTLSYQGAKSVSVAGSASGTAAVITKDPPPAGTEVGEATVLTEVSGRPLILLAGDLPAYRTLNVGTQGPDVAQVEQSLQRLGLNPGTVDDDYDEATAGAVSRLYKQVGYSSPPAPDDAASELTEARRALAELEAVPTSPAASLTEARDRVANARKATLDSLPLGEVAFLPDLPRRVDEVTLKRGDPATGTVASLSGSTLAISTSVSLQDRGLIAPGAVATVSASEIGAEFTASVVSVADTPGGANPVETSAPTGADGETTQGPRDADRFAVLLTPDALPEGMDANSFRGLSLKVTVPVSATDGEVLAVPVAALSAGPDGGARVEVVEGADTRIVAVEQGLVAQGYVEIKVAEGIDEGDEVVVGR